MYDQAILKNVCYERRLCIQLRRFVPFDKKKKYNFEEGIDRKESKELPALSDSLYRSSKYYGLYGVDYGVGFLAARSQAFKLVKGEKTRNN